MIEVNEGEKRYYNVICDVHWTIYMQIVIFWISSKQTLQRKFEYPYQTYM